MNTHNDNAVEGRHPALAKMGELAPKEIPFLATRVLAIHDSKAAARQLRRWRFLAVATSLLSLLLFIFPSSEFRSQLAKILNQDLGEGISRANVDLPQIAHVFSSRGTRLEAYASRSIAIYMELDDQQDPSIAQARVSVPEGVSFVSKKNPEIAQQKSVVLGLKRPEAGQNTKFPFVIRSSDEGDKKLLIEFLDDKGKVVSSRDLSIHFLPPVFPRGLN